ncbi:MAG: hypothetical protein JWR14_161 [Caballeronia sp.]|uniref:phage holin family protein n=1 Tax=Caballeronia sp. TaxID=1931223 RepID=UPI0026196A3F|nr:phage holin family protein [Caballeronia sp.]MDB5830331.1 hypothetical protein [Caballeronia sp.]
MTLGSLTKARGRVRAWKAVGAFCAGRGGDYAELISLELADTKATLLREVIAMVALATGLLFALSFLCIALIATSFGTPHFIGIVWGVAGTWIVVSIAAFFVLRAQLRGASHFAALRSELCKDAQVIKEAL